VAILGIISDLMSLLSEMAMRTLSAQQYPDSKNCLLFFAIFSIIVIVSSL
jgi:hypothetical protein